jgi:hypothetical protein
MYQTPGLDLEDAGVDGEVWRCLYRASNGELFGVKDGNVYFIDENSTLTLLGTIGTPITTPCSMADNGLCVLLVDGTANGYAIDLSSHTYGTVVGAGFYGATKVDYCDTFFILNRPNTDQFYISSSLANFAELTGASGSILAGSISNGGAAYVSGNYTNVPLTGGSGTGATANITVTGGVVTLVTLVSAGNDYALGDSLSANAANLGGAGAGFLYSVDTIGGVAFDLLDIAAKSGYPDNIASLAVVRTEIWLIGELSTEVWFNSGGATFPFERQPGALIQHGCAAKYSVASADFSTFWLSQDHQGRCIVVEGKNYNAARVSTYAIENEFAGYETVDDAIGYTYQQGGHTFYALNFPTAQKSWFYDVVEGLWHERAWVNDNGEYFRHRGNCCAFAYGKNFVGDWGNGDLYTFNLETYTDNGNPIVRTRSFSHLVSDGKRVMYSSMILDMEVGTDESANNPLVSLRWSDNAGKSYSATVTQTLGRTGEYLTCVQYQRLGMARDRIFEVTWSAPVKTALCGAWINANAAGS